MGRILLDLGYVVLGLLLLVMPGTVLPWLCLVFGAAVLLMGVYHLMAYFRRKEGRSISSYFKLVGGAVAAALGVYALLRPQSVQLVLPIIFGLLIAVNGISRIEAAFRVAKTLVARWGQIALLGLLSVVLGAVLALHGQIPLVKTVDAILLSGILLVAEGVLDLCSTVYLGGAKHAKPTPAPAPEPAPEPAPAPELTPAAEPAPEPESPVLELPAEEPPAETPPEPKGE